MDLNLEHILLVSDLDGTLIGENYEIPQRNLEAIKRFQNEGGNFAIATGRAIESGRRYVELTKPNGPCVCLNGGLVYDYAEQRIIWEYPLERETAARYMRMIYDRFPTAGVEYFCLHDIHVMRHNSYISEHLNHESVLWSDWERFDLSQPWYKALFADDEDVIEKINAFTQTFPHEDVRFVSSSENYLEMLPVKTNKGVALREAAGILGFRIEDVYAIGDYYNDVEMLREAGVAAVPANAPDDVKAMADLVVGHCYQGAVADLIEHIERNCLTKM